MTNQEKYIALLSEFGIENKVESLENGDVVISVDVKNITFDTLTYFLFNFNKDGKFKCCDAGEYMKNFKGLME